MVDAKASPVTITLQAVADSNQAELAQKVISIAEATVTKNSEWLQVVGGTYHNLALKTDGTVWAWGLIITGVGTTTDRHTPVQVSGLTGVQAVAIRYGL